MPKKLKRKTKPKVPKPKISDTVLTRADNFLEDAFKYRNEPKKLSLIKLCGVHKCSTTYACVLKRMKDIVIDGDQYGDYKWVGVGPSQKMAKRVIRASRKYIAICANARAADKRAATPPKRVKGSKRNQWITVKPLVPRNDFEAIHKVSEENKHKFQTQRLIDIGMECNRIKTKYTTAECELIKKNI